MAKLEFAGLTQIIGYIRDFLTWIAGFLVNYLPFDQNQIYIGLILLTALLFAGQIIKLIPMIKGGWAWLILVALFFYLLKIY